MTCTRSTSSETRCGVGFSRPPASRPRARSQCCAARVVGGQAPPCCGGRFFTTVRRQRHAPALCPRPTPLEAAGVRGSIVPPPFIATAPRRPGHRVARERKKSTAHSRRSRNHPTPQPDNPSPRRTDMVDVDAQIDAVERDVRSEDIDRSRACRSWPMDDVWGAVTSPDRIDIVMPISRHLRPRPHAVHSRETRAGCRCSRASHRTPAPHLAVTWEFGGGVTWPTVRLASVPERIRPARTRARRPRR